ncbi:MAG: hypothetical protein FJX75_17570 [Armatimonadetes bacterium]|nr:hypothetical protein [Armatimonadota bacterium]
MTRALIVSILVCACVFAVGVAQEGHQGEKPRFFFEEEEPARPPADTPAEPEATQLPANARFDFETPQQAAVWSALDPEAVIDLAIDEGVARRGRGCLRVSYMARETAFEQISAQPLDIEAATTLSFWVKADLPTNLSFGVVERGGAFYQQFAWLTANEWTHLCVPLTSLILSQDTQDASGKLEPERIAEIRLADLANLPGVLGDALGRKAGVHRLCLDDVAISDGPAPAVGAQGLVAEDFERDPIYVLAIGDALLARVPEGEGQALGVLCEERTQRWVGFVMAVGQLDLEAATTLSLRLKASQPMVLSVQLEEWDNSKYSHRVGLDPVDGWVQKTIPLDSLLLETDSDDENGRLDREQIRVLVVTADMSRVQQFPVTFSVDDVKFE